jgi:hypothetical protein
MAGIGTWYPRRLEKRNVDLTYEGLGFSADFDSQPVYVYDAAYSIYGKYYWVRYNRGGIHPSPGAIDIYEIGAGTRVYGKNGFTGKYALGHAFYRAGYIWCVGAESTTSCALYKISVSSWTATTVYSFPICYSSTDILGITLAYDSDNDVFYIVYLNERTATQAAYSHNPTTSATTLLGTVMQGSTDEYMRVTAYGVFGNYFYFKIPSYVSPYYTRARISTSGGDILEDTRLVWKNGWHTDTMQTTLYNKDESWSGTLSHMPADESSLVIIPEAAPKFIVQNYPDLVWYYYEGTTLVYTQTEATGHTRSYFFGPLRSDNYAGDYGVSIAGLFPLNREVI